MRTQRNSATVDFTHDKQKNWTNSYRDRSGTTLHEPISGKHKEKGRGKPRGLSNILVLYYNSVLFRQIRTRWLQSVLPCFTEVLQRNACKEEWKRWKNKRGKTYLLLVLPLAFMFMCMSVRTFTDAVHVLFVSTYDNTYCPFIFIRAPLAHHSISNVCQPSVSVCI